MHDKKHVHCYTRQLRIITAHVFLNLPLDVGIKRNAKFSTTVKFRERNIYIPEYRYAPIRQLSP